MRDEDRPAEQREPAPPEDADLEDLEALPEDADAVRGGFFREVSGFDSEIDVTEAGRRP